MIWASIDLASSVSSPVGLLRGLFGWIASDLANRYGPGTAGTVSDFCGADVVAHTCKEDDDAEDEDEGGLSRRHQTVLRLLEQAREERGLAAAIRRR